jgi:phenylacetate-CoA ligase
LDTNDDPKRVIREIDRFQPDFIGGYVGMLGHLALLKEQGLGKNISPLIIAATGSVLDFSLKDMIKKIFDADLFEVYGATETGPIAYECKNGKYHIMSDLLHLEFFIDDITVKSGEPGMLVVTKLYGGGTPIIRYTAINDIVSPIYEKCGCGISGGLIGKIYGRDDLVLFLPGGKALLPSSFADIYSKILYGLKTTKLKDTQIIQHSLTKIEVLVLIDEKQRNTGPSVDMILSIIKDGLQEKVGSEIEIITREVKEIKRTGARIVSNIDREKFELKSYI